MLEKCLKSAKLDQTLADEQASFTIFAPTNEAFEAIPAATLAKLMKDENRDQLRAILLNHVVAGKRMAADLETGNIKTMSGETIQVTATAGDVQIAGSRVSSPDMQASNGVIHTIGEVIIPKSVNVQELK